MDTRSLLRALAMVALVLTAAAAIGIGAYNVGVTHGIAESGRAISGPAAGIPYVYVSPRPWGFGFFPVFPLFFFLFFLFAVRGFMWRGARRGDWGCRYDGVPPAFDEWHRRAHDERPPSRPSPTGTT